ncbi:peroxisome biogenesis factor 2-like [Ruditapes philippinarum]|uniref:peroxisome biogenesis factor 2-like n=1 Tax=Ruditapes philippinarum TaxID=129788 RepID=UPI00295BBDDF|nr:peroxisome biogenesis factor 2-like [Ruditapes philippinarum]
MLYTLFRESKQMPEMDVPNVALRVSQLDAAELDDEIVSLTKLQLSKLFKYQQTNFLANFEPEINAGIKYLIWKFSVSASESTLGQSMLNLKYFNERGQTCTSRWISHSQKLLYALLLIGCPWLKERSHDLIRIFNVQKWREKIEKVIKWIETGFKVATLVNFLIFLRQGSYLSLLERIVGIWSVFPEKQGMRQVTFEYMTRELLWHGFSEFLFFVLPLINFQRLKNFVVQKFLSSSTMTSRSLDTKRDYTTCAVCGEWPIRAQEFGCPHVFCYFCLQSNYKADPSYACPLCSWKVGDVSSIHNVSFIMKDNDDVDDT